MYDLISIGNISSDIYFNADSLTKKDNRLFLAIGGKYQVSDFELHVGGGGANIAIGATRHGLRSAVVGMIGNNAFRKSILARLRQAHVSTQFVLFNQTDTNISVILLGTNGERTILSHATPHRHTMAEEKVLKALEKTTVKSVYFGNMPDVPVDDRARLKKKLCDKHVFTVVNLSSKDCSRPLAEVVKLLTYTKMLIVNTHEFAQIVKRDIDTLDFRTSVLPLLPCMKDDVVVVTDGKNGSYAYNKQDVYYEPAYPTAKIIDTTGCGDAYTAAFISSYLRHEDVQKAMKAGSKYASRILGIKGAN
jgi:sulfofructose kinase